MRLAVVGKDPDSNPTGSPTIYRTDRESWVVQGWEVSDADALAQMDIPAGDGPIDGQGVRGPTPPTGIPLGGAPPARP